MTSGKPCPRLGFRESLLPRSRASVVRRGHTELYRGAEYVVDFLPKVKIEAAVTVEQVDQVIEAITSASHTGKIGDGKIFVTDIDQIIRIRTGETGEAAI